ncbi:MAG: hypothetical protein ISR79_01850 [Nitrosopumilus sp.]|nr:hypothetical protein [Nitrosopumilus sp.]
MDKQESELLDEMFDIEHKILESLSTLVDAEWDSPTLKLRIEKLLKEQLEISKALSDYDDKQA